MGAIKFTTVIGSDGLIHPPPDISLPQGLIEVSVCPQPTASESLDERLRQICARRGLNPDTLDEITRSVLLDDLAHEDRGTMCPRPGPGAFKGIIKYMAPDFDAPLDDMKEYMELGASNQ